MSTQETIINLLNANHIDADEISNVIVSVDSDGVVLSRFLDNEWVFTQYDISGTSSRSEYTIKWNPKHHNPSLLNDLKRRTLLLIKPEDDSLDGDRKAVAVKTVCNDTASVKRILRSFKGSNVHHLAAFSHPIIFQKLCDVIRDLKYGVQTVEGILSGFKRLEYANISLPKEEHLVFDFERNKLAKKLGKSGKGANPVIIPELYSLVLGLIIDTIEDGSKRIDELKNTKAYAIQNEITEQEAYWEKEYITAVCFMSLMAFTGMRISEVVSLHLHSYDVVDILGIESSILKGKTYKLEDGNERADIWCCAPICEMAINVIHKLWYDERINPNDIMELPRDSSLSRVSRIQLDRANMRSILTKASNQMQLPYKEEWETSYLLLNSTVNTSRDPRKRNKDGSYYWHLSTHTWRRSFAHFGVGNGLISIASVKQQFKHICIGMTSIYAARADVITLLAIREDKTLIKEINRAKREYTTDYLKKTFSDESLASGGFANSILGDEKPRVLTDEEFTKLESSSYTASKSTGYGRCFGKEKCSMNHVFEPSGCIASDCENLSINAEEALRWKTRHKRLSDSLSKMFDSGFINKNVLARELCDLRAAEKVLSDHDIKFKVFEITL